MDTLSSMVPMIDLGASLDPVKNAATSELLVASDSNQHTDHDEKAMSEL